VLLLNIFYKNSIIICFGNIFQQKYDDENVILLLSLYFIRLSNMSSWRSLSLNSFLGAESFSQVFDIMSAKGFQNDKARSNILRFPVNGGLLTIISHFSGSYV